MIAGMILWLLWGAKVSGQETPAAPPALPTAKLAYVRDNAIWIANGDGSKPKRLVRNGRTPCWSPDRTKLAFVRDDNLWLIRIDGKGLRQVTFDGRHRKDAYGNLRDDIRGLSWNPKDNALTYAREEEYFLKRSDGVKGTIFGTTLFSVLLPGGRSVKPERLFDITERGASYLFSNNDSPAWSKSGKYLAFVRNGDIWVAERGERRYPGRGWNSWAWEVTRLYAAAEFDDANDRGSRQNRGVTYLSWSRDEKSLLYGLRRVSGSGSGTIGLLMLEQKEELTVRENRTLPIEGYNPCLSLDSKWVIYRTINDSGGLKLSTLDGKTDSLIVPDGEEPAW